MASKAKSGKSEKATRGSGSTDGRRTAQKAGGHNSTARVGKSGASPSREATRNKEMGSKASKSGANKPPTTETTSVSPVSAPVAEQSNPEAKSDQVSEAPARRPASGWSRSSRVRDQIKFLEEKNKGTRPGGPQRRSTGHTGSQQAGEVRTSNLLMKRSPYCNLLQVVGCTRLLRVPAGVGWCLRQEASIGRAVVTRLSPRVRMHCALFS